MPRVLSLLAVLVPIFAVLYACRSFIPVFDLVASLPLTWPLAVHPDFENAQHAYDEPSEASGQKVLDTIQKIGHNKEQIRPPTSKVQGAVDGQFTRRIVAVGDLHGDLPNAQQVLEMAGIVDEHGNWSGGVDFFVQTGDIIDR